MMPEPAPALTRAREAIDGSSSQFPVPRGAGRLCGRPPSLRHSEGVVARRTETRLHSRGNAVSPSGDTFRDQLTVVVAQNRKTIRARLNQIVDEAEHPSSP